MSCHMCCIPLCDSSSRKAREKSVVIRSYTFLEDKVLRCMWLNNIRQELSFKLTANYRVCSAHFIGGVKDKKKDTNFISIESKSSTIQC